MLWTGKNQKRVCDPAFGRARAFHATFRLDICIEFLKRRILSYSFPLQRALVTTQTDKDKVETELLKQQEKVNILETQVVKCQKDRENLEHEMEMLLDRIKKLSELLDKAKVGIFTKYNFD